MTYSDERCTEHYELFDTRAYEFRCYLKAGHPGDHEALIFWNDKGATA